MSSVAGLSKYIKTLPKTRFSIMGILIMSFLIGCVFYLVDLSPSQGIIEDILYGGVYGIVVFGITSIMSACLNQQVISFLHGINLKIKHSMFLSGLSLTFLGIVLILGCIISHILNVDLILNSCCSAAF
jgi:putative membrane protein